MQLREQHLYYHDQLLPVSRVLPHPNYYTAQSGADIALLELQDPVNVSSHVHAITLPPASETFPAGTPCWVTGWGDLDNRGKNRGQREGSGELGPEAPALGVPRGRGSPRAGSGGGSLASLGGGQEEEEAGCAASRDLAPLCLSFPLHERAQPQSAFHGPAMRKEGTVR